MKGSKEKFMEDREWSITMTDTLYCQLPFELRNLFKSERVYYPGEHSSLYDTDLQYQELYNRYRKAKKDLENYKFQKRHGNKND
jgi:hypothetical protein